MLLVRRALDRRVDRLLHLLEINLVALESAVAEGSIIVFTEDVIRIRRLPIL